MLFVLNLDGTDSVWGGGVKIKTKQSPSRLIMRKYFANLFYKKTEINAPKINIYI